FPSPQMCATGYARSMLVPVDDKRRAEARPVDVTSALCGGNDVDDLAAALRAELNCASRESEQRVVLATPDVHAWVELSTPLANDDLARVNLLTAETLHAEALCVGVTTVL